MLRGLVHAPVDLVCHQHCCIRERLRGARSKRAGSWGNAPPIPGQVRASLPKPWWMPCTSGRSAAPRLKVANASVPNAAAAPWPMPANGWSVTYRSASARRNSAVRCTSPCAACSTALRRSWDARPWPMPSGCGFGGCAAPCRISTIAELMAASTCESQAPAAIPREPEKLLQNGDG